MTSRNILPTYTKASSNNLFYSFISCYNLPLCSHINQKTQFENPVLEAKRKLSVDIPTAVPPLAATPSGNCTHNQALWSRNCRSVIYSSLRVSFCKLEAMGRE